MDSISSNSSKQDDDFESKWQRFSEGSTYLSQGELKNFIVNSTWDVAAIRKRHDSLVKFIEEEWNPERVI